MPTQSASLRRPGQRADGAQVDGFKKNTHAARGWLSPPTDFQGWSKLRTHSAPYVI